ncbi:sporulation initiation factor Spo0A-like protein [Hydrogenoanaerobacterium saccharovorans]|uniref:Sporulation initiation factor Spo0A C terminal n=1 Tax=Hydrogenoanaerobacterium saccharovorans TaxID=474960 RepID=A0A1H8A348_9FIRM|nr:sporulation initiation factor Spo0A C-terminal domain-containing protein [Hydrogenoanaerobacterium saccharovorans]RPF48235.1 sporulation initiation factor Spo0A-like protein [Hydrogenoanaerobacterium saccharovorans]SEM64334.1 Sporulation initiation factor Spo0A C terminal [Hydrogenoanaerobacterium saccharovorans]
MNKTDIQRIMLELGIPTSIKGFTLLTDAINLYTEADSMMDLYEKLARKSETTPSRVERNIRHAISAAYSCGNTELLRRMFKSSTGKQPNNAHFIPRIYLKLSQEKQSASEFETTPIVYICSPCRGNVAENLNLAQMYCVYALNNGCTPIAPHLMFRHLLSDDKPKERARALAIGMQLLGLCHEVWVFGNTITEGMHGEIDYATKHNIKIVYKRLLQSR